MKIVGLSLLLTVVAVFCATAQPVTFNGQGGLLIPPGAPGQTVGITQSPCVVTGIGTIGGCVTIEQVDINLLHTWVGDIAIFLIGPGGQALEFSSGNGGSGDNFTNTTFTDNAPTFITAGAPPYTGTFRPEGRVTNLTPPFSNVPALGTFTFANTYNGTNADGTWFLYVNDYVPLDVGEIVSWSITFNTGGTPPVADAGPDVTVCPGQSTTLTASGGTTYQWSNGATTASTVVSPSATTTYVVTVTQPGCGTDTDDVTVVVEPFSPAIELSAAGICPGGSVTLSVNVPATSYLWSTGATTPTIDVSNPGVYSVTVGTAAGCTGTAQVTVQPLPEPSVSVSVGNSQVCEGDCATVQLTFVGTPPFNYTWQYQQGGNPVGGSQSGSSGGNTTSFLACPPGGPGDVQVVICSLTDANCPN